MGIDHVIQRNHTTQINLTKITSGHILQSAQKHNTRADTRLGDSKARWVDPERSHLNETIVSATGNLYKKLLEEVTGRKYSDRALQDVKKDELYYADGKKVRKDAVFAVEEEMRYPGDLIYCRLNKKKQPVPVNVDEEIDEETIKNENLFLMPADWDEFHKWQERTKQFLYDNYGVDNVASLETHMDENVPHIHALIVPLYKDKNGVTRLSADRILKGVNGDLTNTRALQTEYAERFSDMGYKRGQIFSARDYNSNTLNQMRALATRVISGKLPEDRAEAEKEYRSLYAKYTEVVEQNQTYMHSSKTIEKQSKVMSDQAKTIKEQEEQINAQEEQIHLLQQLAKAEEEEKKGLELMPDREAANVYLSLKNRLRESGRTYFEKTLGVEPAKNLNEEEHETAMEGRDITQNEE